MSSRKRGRRDDGEDFSMGESDLTTPYAQQSAIEGESQVRKRLKPKRPETRTGLDVAATEEKEKLKKCIAAKLADLEKEAESEEAMPMAIEGGEEETPGMNLDDDDEFTSNPNNPSQSQGGGGKRKTRKRKSRKRKTRKRKSRKRKPRKRKTRKRKPRKRNKRVKRRKKTRKRRR